MLSGKKKLHVIIITQRYFAEGSPGLNIRNSSNVHVLMNNVDVRSNRQVCVMMGLKKEYEVAAKSQASTYYPAFVIDRTNEARVSGVQLYTDIFSRCKKVVYNQMISYVINEEDFDKHFTSVGENLAIKNETQKPSCEVTNKSDTSEDESTSTKDRVARQRS